jgi:hypothetical protein
MSRVCRGGYREIPDALSCFSLPAAGDRVVVLTALRCCRTHAEATACTPAPQRGAEKVLRRGVVPRCRLRPSRRAIGAGITQALQHGRLPHPPHHAPRIPQRAAKASTAPSASPCARSRCTQAASSVRSRQSAFRAMHRSRRRMNSRPVAATTNVVWWNLRRCAGSWHRHLHVSLRPEHGRPVDGSARYG